MGNLILSTCKNSTNLHDKMAMDIHIDYQEKQVYTKRIVNEKGYRQIQKKGIMGVALPKLSQVYILRNEPATIIDSSTIIFGNQCLRLVNIAFHTSKMFPSMMDTCNTISQYLQKELQRLYANKHFHIIISENNGFGFEISNYGHFADIIQREYRVLIFSTNVQKRIKMDTHDANSQMQLQWKSVIIKRLNN